jgi:hypothetical protein
MGGYLTAFANSQGGREMRFSYSTRCLLLVASYVAVSSAALKEGSWVLADVLWGATWFMWIYAVLAVVFQRGAARAAALGFAIAAGSFATLATQWPAMVPTSRLIGTFDNNFTGAAFYYQQFPINAQFPNRRRTAPGKELVAGAARGRTVNCLFASVAGAGGYWLGLIAYGRGREVKMRDELGRPQLEEEHGSRIL